MFREQRIVTRCRVEFERLGRRVQAISEDLSGAGTFVRTEDLLPVGAVVALSIVLPEGERFQVSARVAHVLAPAAALALGRRVGIGFQFLVLDDGARELLDRYLVALADEVSPPLTQIADGAPVLLADPSRRRLSRLTNALTEARFDVRAVRDGGDAYQAIQNRPPDILLLADELGHLDGWALIERLSRRPALARIPVVLMSDDDSDITRLQAYRLGVRDFIPRPFTDEELVLRLRRIALERHHSRATVLRGSLGEISAATLLSLLDFERKSGSLLVSSGGEVARLSIAAGRLVRVEGGPSGRSPLERAFALLDWRSGSFEFTASPVEGEDEIGMGTQSLLLEHARVRDEASGQGDRDTDTDIDLEALGDETL